MAPLSAPQQDVVVGMAPLSAWYRRMGVKAVVASVLAATVHFSGKGSTKHLISSENWSAAHGIDSAVVPASMAFADEMHTLDTTAIVSTSKAAATTSSQRPRLMRAEVAKPKVSTRVRPEAWGQLLRREGKDLKAAATTKTRPRLMRAEVAKPKVAPRVRPEAWGKLLRREGKDIVAAAAPASEGELVAVAHAARTRGTASAVGGVIVGVAMLVGFALQVQSTVKGLMVASGLDNGKGSKGKGI